MFRLPTIYVLLAWVLYRARIGDKLARILVIEDDKGCRELYRDILELEGHTVSEALDGVDGLKLADSSNVDLVLTDLIMPNADGIEVIIKLAEKQPSLPIMAISGGGVGGADMYLNAAINLGVKKILKKTYCAS